MKSILLKQQASLSRESFPRDGISQRLGRANATVLIIYASLTSFCLYTCIYAFRKTFAAATFEGMSWWNIDYKIWLVTFQVAGYACSKFLGIKIISELKSTSRTASILFISVAAVL